MSQYTPPPPLAPPVKKSHRGRNILIVVAVVFAFGFAMSKMNPTPTVSAPAPSVASSNDSDFLFVVSDDLSAEGMAGTGKTDADIVSIAKDVCKALKGGASEKAAARTISGAPWLVSGTAADFVSSAHAFYCPKV